MGGGKRVIKIQLLRRKTGVSEELPREESGQCFFQSVLLCLQRAAVRSVSTGRMQRDLMSMAQKSK